jgi:hypothetical protein
MSDGSLAVFIGPLDANDVVAWTGKRMLGYGISILGVLIDIAVWFHRDLSGGVASATLRISLYSPDLEYLRSTVGPLAVVPSVNVQS